MSETKSIWMGRFLAGLLFGMVLSAGAEEPAPAVESDPNAPQVKEGVAIELTRFEITADTLDIRYDIRNDSNDDVWVCTDLDHFNPADLASYLSEDGQTLRFIRRPDLPAGGPDLARAYCDLTRIRSGESLTESLSFALPIFSPYRSNVEPVEPNEAVVRQLNLDIGCYASDILGDVPRRTGGPTSVDEQRIPVPTAVEMLSGCGVLLQANICGVRIPWQVGDAESYPVYSDLLAQWFPQAQQMVIRAQTTFDHVDIDYVRDRLEGVRDDALRDLYRKNLVSVPLEAERLADVNAVLLTEEQVNEIFELPGNWKAFREHYPDSPGLSELSSVGFSADHTEALVYIGNGSGLLTGAGYVVRLRWNGSSWEIQDSAMIWIS